jgi:hypothetical protein
MNLPNLQGTDNLHKHNVRLILSVFVAILLASCSKDTSLINSDSGLEATSQSGYEVWVVDQSNTRGLSYGGTVHIYEGDSLTGGNASSAQPVSTVDLSAQTTALCQESTGASPVRPHMVAFNSTRTHAVLAFVVSGHVVVFDAATRTPVACLRSSPGAGGARQAHMATPAPDDSHILVANQNGKLLERIDADYTTNTFAIRPSATLDLANGLTPNGYARQSEALRPDNAPICPIIDSSSRLAFVTLRGGGLFVVDFKATPMQIIAEYDKATVAGAGCGGAETGGHMYINSGSGFNVYQFPLGGYSASKKPNSPTPGVAYSDNNPHRDAHGMVATKGGTPYLWVFDRGENVAEVFEAKSGAQVRTVDLEGAVSDDPTPDLAGISPDGAHIFVSLRGPNPLSGGAHLATGSTPGVGVIQVQSNGTTGVLSQVAPISNVDTDSVERADPHGIAVRIR